MDTLVQADIFFFITSIAIIAVSALAIVFLSYAIGIARDAKKIIKIVKAESTLVVRDVEEAREFLKKEGVKVSHLFRFASRFIKGSAARKPRRKPHTAKQEEASEGTPEGEE